MLYVPWVMTKVWWHVPSSQCHTEEFHCPKHAIHSSLSPSMWSPGNRQSFHCLQLYLFQNVIELESYIMYTFSDWLFSPSNIHWNFLFAFWWWSCSFCKNNNIFEYYSIVWMYQFFHSFTNWRVSCLLSKFGILIF